VDRGRAGLPRRVLSLSQGLFVSEAGTKAVSAHHLRRRKRAGAAASGRSGRRLRQASPFVFSPWLGCDMSILMRRLPRLLLSLFVSLAFLVSTLAVCNAHLSATEHPDCTRCLTASTSRREDGAPVHLPALPHRCPDYACVHLHVPFIIDSSGELTPSVASWLFLMALPAHGQESSRALLRPPQA
jgi:hypothetical protein